MIQPWEFGRLPEDWIGPMSDLVDEIWVPSKYVLKSYVVSGIPVERVRVVPNGVNTDLFHPGAAPYPLPTRKKFKFLFVGGTIWRKGIDLLLEAYRSTFRREDDVVLIVKDIGVDSFYKGQGIGDIIRQIQDDPAAPQLVYLTEVIEEQDIPGLFTACNCLVHPYRGEGFGLPVLEAMACGIPVIVTSGGATDDFCLQEFSYQIPAGRREINVDGMRLAGGSGYVLEPDLQSIRDMLRTVYENPAIANQKAQNALEHVRKRYTWDNVAGLVQDRIRSLVREPIRRLNAQKLASGILITPAKQEGLSLSA
jgi:glycosyltransferase involved in cell wall biosynthesis